MCVNEKIVLCKNKRVTIQPCRKRKILVKNRLKKNRDYDMIIIKKQKRRSACADRLLED